MPFRGKKHFTSTLMDWYEPEDRPMPWKGEKNPYLVWLSEIILQQTRVEQGLSYYNKFKKKYPAIADLALVDEDELMKDWEGLGYYSRARNLHATARFIHEQLDGEFPDKYADILSLKGVGEYTAAAIASFAYGLPYAVLDGNVYRVLSRYFAIGIPTDSTEGKKMIKALADELLEKKQPGVYNQAIMDFGATICKPRVALCESCPLASKCKAFSLENVYGFPIKEKKIKRKKRYFNYLVVMNRDEVFIRKRKKNDIWRNLYEFPVIETVRQVTWEDLKKEKAFFENFPHPFYGILSHSASYVQELTHRTIIAQFHQLSVNDDFDTTGKDWLKVKKERINSFAFPKIIDLYLSKEL